MKFESQAVENAVGETLFPVLQEVIPRPDIDAGFDFNTSPHGDSRFKMIYNGDTGEEISVMTTDYKLVSNQALLESVEPIADEIGAVIRKASVFGGSRTHYSFIVPGSKVDVGSGDEIVAGFDISNSYDGSSRIQFSASALRLVCSNGMIVGVSVAHQSFIHLDNEKIDQIHNYIKQSLQNSVGSIQQEYAQLINGRIEPRDANKLLKLFPKKTQNTFMEHATKGDPGNAWLFYNAGTYMLTHNMPQNETNHKLQREFYNAVHKAVKANA